MIGTVKKRFTPQVWSLFARIFLLGLIGLCVLWEAWLAPLKPGNAWFALKALPLVLAVPGVFCARRYTSQWLSMLVIFYFLEGATRWISTGLTGTLARIEVLVSILLFIAVVGHARSTGQRQ